MSMAASFLDAPIKRKLMVIGLLTSGLGLLFISLILATESWVEWRDRTVSDMTTYAKVIGANASSALLFNDMDAATQTLSALAATSDIVDAVIYDKAGKTFARFSATQHSPSAFHPSVKPGTYLFDTDRLVVSEPIQFNGKVLGSIYLESDLMGLRAAILEDIAIIFITAFAVFLVTALMFGRLQKTIVGPIMELADGMGNVSAEQDYAVRVAVHSKDEVGMLADTFNVMLERIQRRDTELAQHREHLEEEVLQRTASLAESEVRFRKLFENSNDAIFIHTVDGRILDANSKAENMMGYSVAVLKTMPVPALHPPEELETSKKAFEETISKGFAKFESRFLHSGGAIIDVEISSRIVDREKGIIQGIVRDITERKRAEEKVKKSEARYRSYIELTGQLAWNADAEGKAVEDIPEWRAFTGQSEAQVKGHGWSEAIHPDDRERAMQIWLEAVGRKGKYEAEIRVRRHDGVYCDFLDRGVPLFDESGQIREWVGTAIDITERKKMEEVLRSAHEEVLKNSRRLEMFQQVAVNREMRMVEMKDEVNGLLERLGEPRKYAEVDSLKKK